LAVVFVLRLTCVNKVIMRRQEKRRKI